MVELSVIGLIEKSRGTYDSDGNEISPPKYVKGWHVNTHKSIPELKPFEITVSTPERVYLGADTIFLRFKNEQEFEEVAAKLESN